MKPFVSIITPVYNFKKTIKQTLNSVLKQTFKNLEIVMVDDMSTDNTVSIIKGFQEKNKRIKLFMLDKKGGATGARNKVLREVKGRYIAFLNAYDLLCSEVVSWEVKET